MTELVQEEATPAEARARSGRQVGTDVDDDDTTGRRGRRRRNSPTQQDEIVGTVLSAVLVTVALVGGAPVERRP